MGYYNQTSAKLPPARRSPLEEALYQVQSLDSLELLDKLVRNAAVSPREEKFRRFRLSNPKIAAAIVEVPGCMEALLAMGWVRDEADPEFLCIPQGTYMTMAEVRKLEDAKDRVRKEARSATSSTAAASTATVKVQA